MKTPIWYIIAKAQNGDEWVMPDTYDNEEAAIDRAESLTMAQDLDPARVEYEYRVEHTESRGKAKLIASSLYGKINPVLRRRQAEELGFTIPELTAPPVQPQRSDFTYEELFPLPDSPEAYARVCSECGAFIPFEEGRQVHVTWHNKLLP